jgi:Zn-dependent protease
LPKIGFALILFSFIPGVNILALTKGAKALRRNPQFSLRALLACGSGGFSVLVCLIALAGALLPRGNAARQFLMLPQVQFEMSEVSKAICYVILLLLCFTVHEYAHAFAAWKLGDDTAKESGRLSLNPLVHLDLFGSIILPGIMIWRHSDMLFGWAKPVPVDTSKFANPLRDHRIVSFAGPGVNLAMAMVCFLLLTVFFFFIRLFSPEATSLNLAYPFEATSLGGIRGATFLLAGITFLKQFMYTSLTLGFFNLLPIPPLDGGWILPSLLPERARAFFEKIRPYSFVIFLLLVFSHVTDYLLAIPVLMAWGGLSLVCKVLNFA